VARGVRAYCTACGAQRSLLDETPVNVAGQPSKIGGSVARVTGWLLLLTGSLFGLTLGGIIAAISSYTTLAFVLGGFFVSLSLLFGLPLILGGKMLQKSGTEAERGAHEQAVYAIAERRGGSVTPAELARAVSITEADADTLLTAMAKRQDSAVTLEVDDDGTLRYYVNNAAGGKRIGSRVGMGPRIGMAQPRENEAAAEAEAAAAEENQREQRARR